MVVVRTFCFVCVYRHTYCNTEIAVLKRLWSWSAHKALFSVVGVVQSDLISKEKNQKCKLFKFGTVQVHHIFATTNCIESACYICKFLAVVVQGFR